ncbi:hypothetical protein C5914_002701 [Escherichia coli O19:H42]|nr:hypothetical protein [Escherichia coli O19:H42]
MLPSETMIWQPEFTDKTLSRKPGAVHNEPSTNTLEVHIHNLRDKVGKARIRTVRGFGYMLVANEEN